MSSPGVRAGLSPKRGAGATHLVGAGLEPGARQVKRFLRPNIPVAPKVSSIDEHTPAIPALQGEQAGDLRTQPLHGTGEAPGRGARRGVQGAKPEAPGGQPKALGMERGAGVVNIFMLVVENPLHNTSPSSFFCIGIVSKFLEQTFQKQIFGSL